MEPTLEGIEDFDNNESDEKRSGVKMVIGLLFLLALVFGGLKWYFSDVSDALDTSKNPSVYK